MNTTCLKRPRRVRRRGNILFLTAIFMIGMVAMMAFAIDTGYVYTAESELQRCADSAAIAGASKLLEETMADAQGHPDAAAVSSARAESITFAAYNPVRNAAPVLATADVTVGFLAEPSNSAAEFDFSSMDDYNAVQADVHRSAEQNGRVRLFFAPMLGRNDITLQGKATAAFFSNFSGFTTPSTGDGTLDLLPFALDVNTWNSLMGGTGQDKWKYNPSTGGVSSGADGVKECNLYPQGTGSPGNRGTVDIGGSNNSTADIARQIVYGVNEEDLEHHGGSLEFDEYGELELNGDTGISAGVKDELNSIRGKPRIIPIFSSVTGPGNNAQYTIVQFVGVRIMEVVLTGKMKDKRVMIQPAPIATGGGIPATGDTQHTHLIFSPVRLVR